MTDFSQYGIYFDRSFIAGFGWIDEEPVVILREDYVDEGQEHIFLPLTEDGDLGGYVSKKHRRHCTKVLDRFIQEQEDKSAMIAKEKEELLKSLVGVELVCDWTPEKDGMITLTVAGATVVAKVGYTPTGFRGTRIKRLYITLNNEVIVTVKPGVEEINCEEDFVNYVLTAVTSLCPAPFGYRLCSFALDDNASTDLSTKEAMHLMTLVVRDQLMLSEKDLFLCDYAHEGYWICASADALKSHAAILPELILKAYSDYFIDVEIHLFSRAFNLLENSTYQYVSGYNTSYRKDCAEIIRQFLGA